MTPDALIELSRHRRLVLGSGSPRRKQLLGKTGVEFRQVVSDIEETIRSGEDPFEFAVRIAEDKARSVVARSAPDDVVIAGDTVVVLDGEMLDKPADAEDALRILGTLSGRKHTVATALALADRSGLLASDREETKVQFNQVTEDQLRRYIDSGEPMDKAGAYGIQGMGAFLVDSIEGNLDNVIGLPMNLLNRLAQEVLLKLQVK